MNWIANVKAVKADVAKHELTFSFTVDMDAENMEKAEELANYVDKDHGTVELKVIPHMQPMFNKKMEVTLTKQD